MDVWQLDNMGDEWVSLLGIFKVEFHLGAANGTDNFALRQEITTRFANLKGIWQLPHMQLETFDGEDSHLYLKV